MGDGARASLQKTAIGETMATPMAPNKVFRFAPPPEHRAKHLFVFLHGGGATPESMISVAFKFQARFPSAALVVPSGFDLPAEDDESARSPYSLMALGDDGRMERLDAILPRVEDIVRREQTNNGIPAEGTVLIGFSQGGHASLAKRLVQIGIRTMNGHQREQAEKFGVEVVEMRMLPAYERLKIRGPVYISFDVDVLDPACAPGISHREPGGMTTREAIAHLHAIEGEIVGADVVEYNPAQDISGMTAVLAAKMVKEILGRMKE